MRFVAVILLSFTLGGCADFLSAMSAVNEGMGSQCATYEASYAGYDPQTYEYVQNTYFYRTDAEGRRELNWLNGRLDSYLSMYTFGTWYETSPITDVEYKINVYCAVYY